MRCRAFARPAERAALRFRIVPSPQVTSAGSRAQAAAALVIAEPSAAQELGAALWRAGYAGEFAQDPYAAAVELLRRPMAYRALVVSLAAVYPAELELIGMVKRRLANIQVVVAHTSGRPSAQARALELGADALLEGDRLIRARFVGQAGPVQDAAGPPPREPNFPPSVLSVAEIQALLER